MDKPEIAGWQVTKSEKGVEMATVNLELFTETLKYIEHIESELNEKWIKAEVPKDGTKVIRWAKVWKIPLCVFYQKNRSDDESCVWITGDLSHSYPEESFLPNIYMPLLKKPDVI
jgi:hypothetical protein